MAQETWHRVCCRVVVVVVDLSLVVVTCVAQRDIYIQRDIERDKDPTAMKLVDVQDVPVEYPVPICRRGATIKVLLSRFLVGIGGVENGKVVDTVVVCTLGGFQWQPRVVPGTPRVCYHAASIDRLPSKALYLHGGFHDLWETEVSNEFLELDTQKADAAAVAVREHDFPRYLKWKVLASPPITGRARHTLTLVRTSDAPRDHSDKLYLFGGQGAQGGQGDRRECYNDILEYNIWADEWKVLSPAGGLPAPRHQHSMNFIKQSRLLLVGGLSASNQPLVDVHIYNTTAATWTELILTGAVPARLAGHTTNYMSDERVLVLGGNQRTSQTLRLNLLGRSWDLVPGATLQISRYGHSTVPSCQSLFVIGGCDEEPWDAERIDPRQGLHDPPRQQSEQPQPQHPPLPPHAITTAPILLPPPIANSAFTEWVSSTRFSDATIILDDQTLIPVHMVILATGSEYFGHIAQFQGAEVSSREIRMSDVKHQTMLQFLEYTYSGGVLPAKQAFEDTVLTYKLADRLGSKCLKDHLCEHLTDEVTMDNLIELVNLGTETNSTKIVTSCTEYLKERSEEEKNDILSKLDSGQMLLLLNSMM